MPSRRECANAIRALTIDAIEQARSGHPGAPLGMADMAEALWRHFFRHNPANPEWPNRDRFVLSNGHASMLLYSLLHLTGYNLPIDEIRNFRQLGSKTPGHPERGLTCGVEMSTGPLGQGIASAVGMALAEALLAARFNRPGFEIVNHYTYAFCGDGCMMEGVSHEACSLAGTWGLGKLILFYDANGVSIDGRIDQWFNEDVAQRFAAYKWHVVGPIDGHDSAALDSAIQEAQNENKRPSLIICNTHIGFGSPKIDSELSHGAPLGKEAAEATRKTLGWREKPFVIPEKISAAWNARSAGEKLENEWKRVFSAYQKAFPELASEYLRRIEGGLPKNWPLVAAELKTQAVDASDDIATRIASKNCLEILVKDLPEMIGGSADLSGSVGTRTKSSQPLDYELYNGNYLFYGVREFGMGAIMNGLAIHGGFIPYAGTFLSFSDQAKNAIRLCALMGLHVVWVMTHDSIGVGEDGPTHQPVEQIPSLRVIPNLNLWRPCDSVETAQAWIAAVEIKDRPTVMSLSRQKLPHIERTDEQIADISKGGYILRGCSGEPDIIIIATGSEVFIAVEAAEKLEKMGYKPRVVSLPCAEVFAAQPAEWKEKVLPDTVRARLAVEAASPAWWGQFVGLDGAAIGMETFGVSAPGSELLKKYGFTSDNIVERAVQIIKKQK